MEKEQFEELVKLLKELNEYLKSISSRMGGIDDTLELIKDEIRGKSGKAHFRS